MVGLQIGYNNCASVLSTMRGLKSYRDLLPTQSKKLLGQYFQRAQWSLQKFILIMIRIQPSTPPPILNTLKNIFLHWLRGAWIRSVNCCRLRICYSFNLSAYVEDSFSNLNFEVSKLAQADKHFIVCYSLSKTGSKSFSMMAKLSFAVWYWPYDIRYSCYQACYYFKNCLNIWTLLR